MKYAELTIQTEKWLVFTVFELVRASALFAYVLNLYKLDMCQMQPAFSITSADWNAKECAILQMPIHSIHKN